MSRCAGRSVCVLLCYTIELQLSFPFEMRLLVAEGLSGRHRRLCSSRRDVFVFLRMK